MADFESIVRSVINLEEVKFEGLNVSGNYQELAKNPIQLPKLKKLIIEHCGKEAINIVLCIAASSLVEFHIHIDGDNAFDFTPFLKAHKTIKHITMSGALKHPNAFNQLKLIHLRIYNDGDVLFLRDVIKHQPNLKHLDLLYHFDLPYGMDEDDDSKPIVNDDVFTVICSLTNLETLKIGIGQLSPNTIDGLANLVNLKELVINPLRNSDYDDFDNDYDYDQNKKRQHLNYQTIFRKVVATMLPNLNSFTWSFRNSDLDLDLDCDESFYSYEDRLMEAAHHRELAALGNFDVIKKMASCFLNLKCLEIKMSDSVDTVNIHDILELFPYLEILNLKMNSTFNGAAIPLHKTIKHMKVDEIEENSLIQMMRLMPTLESLKISNTRFQLNKRFLLELQATIPHGLKKLVLNLHSQNYRDFAIENIKILQHIIKSLEKCEIKLTGRGSFDSISETIDRSIDPNIGVSMPRSPKGYYPGDDYENHESYLKLWK